MPRIAGVTSRPILKAIMDIRDRDMTWKEAATRNKVTEGGILKAMRRLKMQPPPRSRQTSEPVSKAVADIEQRGMTWKESARINGVSESAILRAMRRMGLR